MGKMASLGEAGGRLRILQILCESERSSPKIQKPQSKNQNEYNIHYGNTIVTRFTPEYFEYSNLVDEISVKIDDDEVKSVKLGQKIVVNSSFMIIPKDKIRANIIGYGTTIVDESGIKITKDMIKSRFSMDKKGQIYRVEFYEISDEKDKFIGMILVEFAK